MYIHSCYFSSPNNFFALPVSSLSHIPATALLTLDSFSSSIAAIFEMDFGELAAATAIVVFKRIHT
jgi:hypothetical protein